MRLERLVIVGAWAVATASVAHAQIAPGPLSKAHAEFDGPLKCLECHGSGGDALRANCLACHEEISWLLSRKRGLHETSKGTACAKCHGEHAGREKVLVVFEEGVPERFDHKRAGWPLAGKHAPLKCADCHKPAFRVSKSASLSKRKDRTAGFLGLEPECVTCHKDVHAGRLEQNCKQCHVADAWRPAPGFDHAKTKYPLTGAHVKVDCAKCHRSAATVAVRPASLGKTVVFGPLRHEECSPCHADPHAGRLGAGCAKCHTTESFRRVDTRAFDHARTRYPLLGRHVSVACEKCHDPRSPRGKKLPFETCDACHRDAHAGQALLAGKKVDCAACHTVDGFRPSTYTVERHQESTYRLVGKHAGVKCADCHVRRDAALATGRASGKLAFDLRPRHDRCADCHKDAHAGQFARRRDAGECASCHVADGWKPSLYTAREHAKLGVSLEAKHDIACAKCHEPGNDPRVPRPEVLLASNAPSKFETRHGAACVVCHENPHGDQFAARSPAGSCGRCHDAATFKSANRFDHDRDSRFPLFKSHGRLRCEQCHDRTITVAGRLRAVYSPVTLSCKGCHATVCTKVASGDEAVPRFCTAKSAPSR